MARYLHQHTDQLSAHGADYSDVVVDRLDEVLWRLRALCGLKNARQTKIVAIGRAGGWGPGGARAPERAREKWQLDIQTVTYEELGAFLAAAFADPATVQAAQAQADQYLQDPAVKLEADRQAVNNAFVLADVFRAIMARAGAEAITISGCMRTVMPIAQTSACLTLSLLNDAGYLAFCESDFVVIPAGLLLAHISGSPQFLNDPTYPHQGVITLAHCTAPRRMDGKTLEPVRLMTHFESDYGVAPKVAFRAGQTVTSIIPDFAHERWIGLTGQITDVPSLSICRSQMDVTHRVNDDRLASMMPGFHWETIYGDYGREVGYALQRTPIKWTLLT
jgi:L-fucose isomerase-like protein